MARILLPGTVTVDCGLESFLELLYKQVQERGSMQPQSPTHRVFESYFERCDYNETSTHINVFKLDEATGRSVRVDTREIDIEARSVEMMQRHAESNRRFFALLFYPSDDRVWIAYAGPLSKHVFWHTVGAMRMYWGMSIVLALKHAPYSRVTHF
jgi:hypothetical protein